MKVPHLNSGNTFGVGIVRDNGEILANTRSIYTPEKGGIVPREAVAHHSEKAKEIVEKSLQEAKLKLADIDLISFAAGPGLLPCLRIGAVIARTLALRLDKPIMAVNHMIGHVEIGKLTAGCKDAVVLYVSGGNSLVLTFTGGRYREFGSTQDIAIGNALDMFAREAGLKHPGGPKIEQLAKKGSWISLPYVVKGCDLSFSGIVTDAIKKLKTEKLEDICFSLQETCFSMLTEVVERAVAHTDKEEVLLTGGVAANKRLQEMLSIMCKERGAKFHVVPAEYSGDNGAMIAWTGLLAYKSGQRQKIEDTEINRFWRTDQVDVTWLK